MHDEQANPQNAVVSVHVRVCVREMLGVLVLTFDLCTLSGNVGCGNDRFGLCLRQPREVRSSSGRDRKLTL